MYKYESKTEKITDLEELGAKLGFLDYGLDNELMGGDINAELWALLQHNYKPDMIYTIAAVLNIDSDQVAYRYKKEVSKIIDTKIMMIDGEMTFCELNNIRSKAARRIKELIDDIYNIKNAALQANDYNNCGSDIKEIEKKISSILHIMKDKMNISTQEQIITDTKIIKELTLDLLLGLEQYN